MSEFAPSPSGLLASAQERLDDVLSDAITLMRVESPSSDHDAVAQSADAVEALVRTRLDADPERLVIDGVTHLRWRWGATTRVVIVAHHDTVWPTGTLERLPAEVRDGVLRGPGSVDMKTGISMAVHALAILRTMHGETALDGVTLLVTGDEEIGSPTSRSLIEETARGASAALVLEAGGDSGELKTQRKGTSMYRFAVHGLAAHAGLEPDRGVNAVVGLAEVILAVNALHGSEPGLTVVPSVISGGTTTNTVPAEAVLDVDVRVTSVASQLRVDAAMHAIAPSVTGATVTVTGGPNRAPLEAAMSADLFALAAQIAVKEDIGTLAPLHVGGASDGNFTAGAGVPTLDGLGAWGGGAHAESEHALVSGIPARVALLAGLIRTLTNGGGLD